MYSLILALLMNIFFLLLDLFFPRSCLGCGTTGTYVCGSCKKELVPHPDRCPFCHRVMKYGQVCYDCRPEHRHLQWIMVAFVYTSFIKKLIRDLKFAHKYDIAWFLAERIALLIQTNPSLVEAQKSNKLFISFVPSHRRRRRVVKWYNQSELLATHAAKALWITYIQAVSKQKYTTSQTKCTRQQRLVNLLWAFTIKTRETLPPWTTVVLVDDITTTWATLNELAKTRKKHYSSITIWWVVVGRHGK